MLEIYFSRKADYYKNEDKRRRVQEDDRSDRDDRSEVSQSGDNPSASSTQNSSAALLAQLAQIMAQSQQNSNNNSNRMLESMMQHQSSVVQHLSRSPAQQQIPSFGPPPAGTPGVRLTIL